MAIQYRPTAGTILICDFNGYNSPEIVKRRPVVVLSSFPNGICIVIPLSTTPPRIPQKWHYCLKIDPPLPKPYQASLVWAKGDLVCHVSFQRLFVPFRGKDAQGHRKYVYYIVSDEELEALRTCVLEAISH